VLWYKAWLETRSRFLTSLTTLTLFSGILVHHAQALIRPEWKSDFNRLLFVNQQFLVIMWVLSVVLLGMGGIVREKAIGTSSLTLALPVSRARLLGVRVGMGVLQAIVLGVMPWVAVFLVSSFGLLRDGYTCFLIGRRRIYGASPRLRVGAPRRNYV
jgi:ABC-2 type transport system permease protein